MSAPVAVSPTRRMLQLERRVRHLERVTRQQRKREAKLVARLRENATREQLQMMMRGTNLVKFHYSSSKKVPSTRFVQLSRDMRTLTWRRQEQLGNPTSVAVSSLVGVLFGAKSATFVRRVARPPEWLCFSLVTSTRTVDFAGEDEEVVLAWVLGLQNLLEDASILFDRSALVALRGWMKVKAVAHSSGLPVPRLLARRIKETYLKLQGERGRSTRSLLLAHQGEHTAKAQAAADTEKSEDEEKLRAIDVALSADMPLPEWLNALPHRELVKAVDETASVLARVARLTVQGASGCTPLEALQMTEESFFDVRRSAKHICEERQDAMNHLRTLVLRLAAGEAADLTLVGADGGDAEREQEQGTT